MYAISDGSRAPQIGYAESPDRLCGEEMGVRAGREERWGAGGGVGRHGPAANWVWAPPEFGRGHNDGGG